MNVIKYRVSLDMFDTLSQTKIKAKKCDSACQIHITLTDHGKIYKIGEGCYATFNAKKSDGTFVYDKCSIEGNTIVYDFGASIDKDGICQVSACEGIVECEVTLYNANSEQLTSPRFTLFIDGTVYNGEEIISTPEANVLKELINETNNLINDVETRLENGEFKGEKGDKGDKGEDAITDQTYNPESKNAQSGKAVAEAIGKWQNGMSVTNVRDCGAIGDGVADDTDAIQEALDKGGIIYFPPGRYKATKQLTAIKPCCIKMFKSYPATWKSDAGVIEYPQTPEDNWMGARIETYATDGCGMLLGDGVEVDGLCIRAMTGFGRHNGAAMASGVLLKLDATQGKQTYQSAVRLSHIKLENDCGNGYPESMFDFVPNHSYHCILEDIGIGRSPAHPRCQYGFRAHLGSLGDAENWCNNVFIRNMCIDMRADICMYVDGARCASGWVFDGLTIQAYPKNTGSFPDGHESLMVLKNMQDLVFLGSYLWDTNQAEFSKGIFQQEKVENITCVGCSSDFDSIETVLSGKMKQPQNLNITSLEMSVKGDETTGGNVLTLKDGNKQEKSVVIPAVSPSDEQIGNSISNWMDENAAPQMLPGRNKFNASSQDNIVGYFYWSAGTADSGLYYDKDSNMWTTHYIKAKKGDIIRITRGNGIRTQAWSIIGYDKNKQAVWRENVHTSNTDNQDWEKPEIRADKVAYIRICFKGDNSVPLADIATAKLLITINDSTTEYEEYYETEQGGIGQYIDLSSISIMVDQTYNPESEYAQSGKAVAEAILQSAKVIRYNQSGNAVVINNTDSIEPNLKVKLTSADGSITDFSNINMYRYGKNLFNIATASRQGGASQTSWNDDVFVVTQTNSSQYMSANFIIPNAELLIGKKITVSAKAKTKTGNEAAAIRLMYINSSGTGQGDGVVGTSSKSTKATEFTELVIGGTVKAIDSGKTGLLCLCLYSNFSGTGSNGATSYYEDIQIEIGEAATEYEPFVEPQTVTAKADGTIEGFTIATPSMALWTSTNNVIINVEYDIDIKKYIDNGLRRLETKLLGGG